MKISTRGRYGLRAMVELAANHDDPRLLKEIAGSQDISMKYLGRIISALQSAGLVFRTSDGYLLSEEPAEISCHEIIKVLEGSLAPCECVDNEEACERLEDCRVIDVFERLKDSWVQELEAISLKDLAGSELEQKTEPQAGGKTDE